MAEKNYTGTVPDNYRGEKITAQATRDFESLSDATAFFRKASQRLMDVEHWQQWAGKALADFVVSDRSGKPLNVPAEQGLLIRIDIPGPGSASGEGYDWVRIEEIASSDNPNVESIAIRVRPVAAPGSGDAEPAHFYDSLSTSTFTITRENGRITAAVYDRNIAENTSAKPVIDKVRNAVTGFVGKKVFSKVQWQLLVDGLLR
ncbi:MAG: hypothetical protein J7619_28015 [Dyadobacter sp.]|uniref:hypothetical protein n=1 Tax=Dyadobacter sp. TaxID=1914288 RepID=UPI001B27E3AD|nr:hypothetical protein [Dyadobacter sp.]MBO9616566.1 hypothetical protein [Dyadobacter sp.]